MVAMGALNLKGFRKLSYNICKKRLKKSREFGKCVTVGSAVPKERRLFNFVSFTNFQSKVKHFCHVIILNF